MPYANLLAKITGKKNALVDMFVSSLVDTDCVLFSISTYMHRRTFGKNII